MNEIDRVIAACRSLIDAGSRGVLVTVVRTEGSTYRRAGARAVIAEDGTVSGAISGGCLEADLAERLATWLSEMTPRMITYDSTRADDLIFGLGLGCRGMLELLIEPFDAAHPPPLVTNFKWNGREPAEWTTLLPNGQWMIEILRPPRAIVIFGSGADVGPVARMSREMGWIVEVRRAIDSNAIQPRSGDIKDSTLCRRSAARIQKTRRIPALTRWATVCRRSAAERRSTHQQPNAAWPQHIDGFDAAIVMTHNFPRDAEILAQLLPSPIRYIGLLGPKSRGDELLAEIGGSRDARLHNPIGLDLGGETPEEIALSIVAEIQAVFERRSARPLRELDVPIHESRNTPA